MNATETNARTATATILSGSLAQEHNNVVRYDWSEFAVVIDWAPGHEQLGAKQTRGVLAVTTREAACVAAAAVKGYVVDTAKLATRVRLELVNRTCTVATEFEPDHSEDGDGTPRTIRNVIAGSDWDLRSERNMALETWNARRTLNSRAA